MLDCVQVQFNMAGNESGQELHASWLFIPVERLKKLCSLITITTPFAAKEELVLRYYFSQGYQYDVIVFLSKFHGE